jgi:hypothetical protein
MIAVSPVLDFKAMQIEQIIERLAAQNMATDPPIGRKSCRLQVIVICRLVPQPEHFERAVQ